MPKWCAHRGLHSDINSRTNIKFKYARLCDFYVVLGYSTDKDTDAIGYRRPMCGVRLHVCAGVGYNRKVDGSSVAFRRSYISPAVSCNRAEFIRG